MSGYTKAELEAITKQLALRAVRAEKRLSQFEKMAIERGKALGHIAKVIEVNSQGGWEAISNVEKAAVKAVQLGGV
tara:strand:- start:271 stop:498 length:228 start_codon:yes stop_codon:yes gene_type:complete